MKLVPQVYRDHTGQGKFKNSFTLCWVALISSIALQVLALAVAGKDGVDVLVVGVPAQLALAGAWSGITNWAEVRGSGAGFPPPTPPAPPDQSKQNVNVVVKPPEDPKLD